jgi:hypothetical protein
MPARVVVSRRVAWLMLGLALQGCTSGWRSAQVAPAQVIQGRGPAEVQIKRTDGSYLYLRDPAVAGDSIVGWEATEWNEGPGLTRRAIALDDVSRLAVRGADTPVNAFLGVLLGLAVWALAFAIACAGDCLE